MSLVTTKLYLKNAYLCSCRAKVTDVSVKGIVTDRTVAFPEGGGQEGDNGLLEIVDGVGNVTKINFSDVQKGVGRMVYLENFPTIQVCSPIYHVVAETDLDYFKIGMNINIKIDLARRAKLTVNHSGLHVVLMGIEKVRPGITGMIVGCHIATEYARIDFAVGSNKFSQDELLDISDYANAIIASEEEITVFPHPQEEEAWYWKCRDIIVPCGGTHLRSTKYIDAVSLRRKNIGKNTERIIATFSNAEYDLSGYYEE